MFTLFGVLRAHHLHSWDVNFLSCNELTLWDVIGLKKDGCQCGQHMGFGMEWPCPVLVGLK